MIWTQTNLDRVFQINFKKIMSISIAIVQQLELGLQIRLYYLESSKLLGDYRIYIAVEYQHP